MSKIILQATFNNNTNVAKAFDEAKRIAEKLDCFITFDLNKIKCHAKAEGNTDKAVEMYNKVKKTNLIVKIVTN